MVVIDIFTGIVEEVGKVVNIRRGNRSFQIDIRAQNIMDDVKTGDSIAVDGVCLTVLGFSKEHFTADVMPETFDKTTLKHLKNNDRVNLERALRLGDRMGGHIVQGHVDAVGTILQKERLDIAIIYRIKAPESVLRYTVPKGSIAVDGVSLTVIDVFSDSFTVSLIPHTANITVLGLKSPGELVNLESDIIGRYVEKLVKLEKDDQEGDKLTLNFLAEHGFI